MILPHGDDFVDNLDRGMATSLRLSDFLRVAAPVGDEVEDVKHGNGDLVGDGGKDNAAARLGLVYFDQTIRLLLSESWLC